MSNTKKNTTNIWKNRTALYWFLFFAVICFGGFYDWGAMALTVCMCVWGIVRILRSGKCYRVKDWSVYAICLLAFGSVLSLIFAVDRGMAFVGVLHFMPILAWLFLNMQYEEEERGDALDGVADAGVLSVVLTGVSYFIPSLKDWFWMADRLGGPLQYSNSFAMFLLLGMMVLTGKMAETTAKDINDKGTTRVGIINGIDKTWLPHVKWSILFLGILLTGSRTVLLLTIGVIISECIGVGVALEQRKILRIRNGIALCLGVILAVVMVSVTGSFQNMARLATVFTSNSTVYGRLLYWQDALPQIIKHPLGMGYMGYSYTQGSFQTGIYKTLFVHNDFLQAFLDTGFLGGVALLALFGMQLKKSNYRLLWIVMGLHCMVDFDLQYPVMWMVLILICNYGQERELLKKGARREHVAYLTIAGVVAGFFLIPFTYHYFDQYEKAVYFYPAYTVAKEPLVYQNPSYADDILRYNTDCALAWDAKAFEAYQMGDIKGYVSNKQEVLKRNRYEIAQFQNYVDMLEQCAIISEANQLTEQAAYCREAELFALDLLHEVEEETSKLAYMIRDIPDFTLNMP